MIISFKIIKKAKTGCENANSQILHHYLKNIKKFSKDDDFIQQAMIEIERGIKKFK